MRHADGRDPGHGSEVHRHAGAPGMVAAGGIDEQQLWAAVKGRDGSGEERPLPERQ
jgi:hypothetical protein